MLAATKHALRRGLPEPLFESLRTAKRSITRNTPWAVVRLARQAFHPGDRYCPVCESRTTFRDTQWATGDKCEVCGAIQRARLIWLYLSRHTDILANSALRILHVAPEASIAVRLMHLPGYMAGDLEPGRYLVPRRIVPMDLTAASFPTDTFDVVICNHVLEHIPDDKAAMREILRILKPGGWAMLMVPAPHRLPVTIEDPDAPPEERARRFGQENHVRLYGADYADILRAIGFEVRVWMAREAEPHLCGQWTLDPAEEVYVGLKG